MDYNLSKIEQKFLQNQPSSQSLLIKYMNGNKKVTYEQILVACKKEKFAKRLNYACRGHEFLIPLLIIPVIFYTWFFDEL